MARRPQGTKSWIKNTSGLPDAVIKAANGVLYSVNLSWTGATADDVVSLHDCATVAEITDANRIFTFRVPTAVGSFPAALPTVGKEFLAGLVFNQQASGIKLGIDVSYD